MTHDYPDNTRLFHLVGTEITIPINIEASDVTLPVSIESQAAIINVNIKGAEAYVPIWVVGSQITLDVNIKSSKVTININFSDQSVAVFDAAKWFAHEADQVFSYGTASGAEGTEITVVDYTVPADKVFFAVGVSCVGPMIDGEVYVTSLKVQVEAATVCIIGSRNGVGLPLDTPLRATEGEHVYLKVQFYAQSSPHAVYGSVWGYLEDE